MRPTLALSVGMPALAHVMTAGSSNATNISMAWVRFDNGPMVTLMGLPPLEDESLLLVRQSYIEIRFRNAF